MKFLRTLFLTFYAILLVWSYSSAAFAVDGGTVLPDTERNVTTCQKIMVYVNANMGVIKIPSQPTGKPGEAVEADKETTIKDIISSRGKITINGVDKEVTYTDILACAIMTGDIKVWMIPYFIRYILEFIIGLAGLVAVGGVVYGGYLYLFAGLSSDKDKGKNAIKNSLLGLVLIFTAWAIVNIVISLVTF